MTDSDTTNKNEVGKWVPLCCTLGGGVDLGLGTTYKKPCIKFSRFSGQPKNFYHSERSDECIDFTMIIDKKMLDRLKFEFILSSRYECLRSLMYFVHQHQFFFVKRVYTPASTCQSTVSHHLDNRQTILLFYFENLYRKRCISVIITEINCILNILSCGLVWVLMNKRQKSKDYYYSFLKRKILQPLSTECTSYTCTAPRMSYDHFKTYN
ncbi:hypothetical protein AGLY_013988 [Aphis glycines]|uniref:Uncharacterized protein n=1 Tax=Aphis glycines TaxID=307491 RepID=A0A6G0T5M7_APHGL|nr:hypothetical protein AGLY_013988 [Aphis glycines]